MVLNTVTVGTAVTPAVVSTFLYHYLNRKPRALKPTAHISYDEGLHLIRQFLVYASHHTVEEIQTFTSQWVPCPIWVRVEHAVIDQKYITNAAEAIQEQLGHHGIERVGGKEWWQWRRPGSELKAEWIEMKSDYVERTKTGDKCKRVMLYVHGGAYFFGSVDEHRYQMQRHARKLKARVLARLLVILRDRGIPLPAGAILISPWVDLTHSFPSVAEESDFDYIPAHGFQQRPSPSWPPPNSDDMIAMMEAKVKKLVQSDHTTQQSESDAIQGFHIDNNPALGTTNDTAAAQQAASGDTKPVANTVPGPGRDLSIMIDGKLIEIKDQIQMYASNQLISHPLVSPILQPSLGGLPPLLILTGGGEMLRDEQIYVAHKAAHPQKYPPGEAFLNQHPQDNDYDKIKKWKPTDVQLQVWDDMCHVGVTLSFTRPAKYMYRSIAQFGAWALARAQKTGIEIMDDDDVSVISDSESDSEEPSEKDKTNVDPLQVGKAGDPLPAFKNHMIRQRVDRYGNIFHLQPASELVACNMDASQIGVIKEGPVKKWMKAKQEWDTKFASAKRKVQKQRAKEMADGYENFSNGEVPPPSALAGRRRKGDLDREQKKKRSWGMSLWALWGSKHDEMTIVREEQAEKAPDTTTVTPADGANASKPHDNEANLSVAEPDKPAQSRSRSRRRTVVDSGQADEAGPYENTSTADLIAMRVAQSSGSRDTHLSPDFVAKHSISATNTASTSAVDTSPADHITEISNVPMIMTDHHDDWIDTSRHRPKANGIAFPFTLKHDAESSVSVATLTSDANISPQKDIRIAAALESGIPGDDGIGIDKEVEKIDGLGKGKELAVESGNLVSAERPPLTSFVTAQEELPKVS